MQPQKKQVKKVQRPAPKKQVAKIRKHKVTITQVLLITSLKPATDLEDKKDLIELKKGFREQYLIFNEGWPTKVKAQKPIVTIK